jgi:hypothetical protein
MDNFSLGDFVFTCKVLKNLFVKLWNGGLG